MQTEFKAATHPGQPTIPPGGRVSRATAF